MSECNVVLACIVLLVIVCKCIDWHKEVKETSYADEEWWVKNE